MSVTADVARSTFGLDVREDKETVSLLRAARVAQVVNGGYRRLDAIDAVAANQRNVPAGETDAAVAFLSEFVSNQIMTIPLQPDDVRIIFEIATALADPEHGPLVTRYNDITVSINGAYMRSHQRTPKLPALATAARIWVAAKQEIEYRYSGRNTFIEGFLDATAVGGDLEDILRSHALRTGIQRAGPGDFQLRAPLLEGWTYKDDLSTLAPSDLEFRTFNLAGNPKDTKSLYRLGMVLVPLQTIFQACYPHSSLNDTALDTKTNALQIKVTSGTETATIKLANSAEEVDTFFDRIMAFVDITDLTTNALVDQLQRLRVGVSVYASQKTVTKTDLNASTRDNMQYLSQKTDDENKNIYIYICAIAHTAATRLSKSFVNVDKKPIGFVDPASWQVTLERKVGNARKFESVSLGSPNVTDEAIPIKNYLAKRTPSDVTAPSYHLRLLYPHTF